MVGSLYDCCRFHVFRSSLGLAFLITGFLHSMVARELFHYCSSELLHSLRSIVLFSITLHSTKFSTLHTRTCLYLPM